MCKIIDVKIFFQNIIPYTMALFLVRERCYLTMLLMTNAHVFVESLEYKLPLVLITEF